MRLLGHLFVAALALVLAIPCGAAILALGAMLDPETSAALSRLGLVGLFALVPLVRIAADDDLMRLAPTGRNVIRLAWLVVGIVVALVVVAGAPVVGPLTAGRPPAW